MFAKPKVIFYEFDRKRERNREEEKAFANK